jgi:hypothetical protein
MMREENQEQTLSKQVSDRLSSARTVLDVLRTEAPALADKLGGVFEPWLAETAGTPFTSLLQAFDGRLSECRDRLADAAGRHLEIQTEADELDRRSEAAATRLGETMLAVRDTVRGVYGFDQLAHFGFPERTPSWPSTLLERSREVFGRMTDPTLEVPPSRLPDYDLDCPRLARTMTSPIEDLGEILGAVREHRREVRKSECRQGEALADFNDAFLQIAGSLESWLRMAGQDDKADRVRPSRRRPGLIYGVRAAGS